MNLNNIHTMDYSTFTLFTIGMFAIYYLESNETRANVHRTLYTIKQRLFYKLIYTFFYLKKVLNINKNANEKMIEDGKFLDNDNNNNNININVNIKKEIPYIEKYLEKYDKMECIELSKEKLESLKNCIVMETTPLGVVIMFYDVIRETFTYYSDNTIPYRFLEVVGRKYVCTFHCKSIYVDMIEVIKEAEEKIEQVKIDKEKLELEKKEKLELEKKEKLELEKEQEKLELDKDNGDYIIISSESKHKKSVFAKLKKYNDSTNTNTNTSTNTNTNTSTNLQKQIILKDKMNRYTCEGKLVNYSIIKKVDKKLVDKNYTMTFSDYKKMIKQE